MTESIFDQRRNWAVPVSVVSGLERKRTLPMRRVQTSELFRGHIIADGQGGIVAAEKDTLDLHDVTIVSADRNRDMGRCTETSVGGIEVNPAKLLPQ
jgi:hypothetical protein